MIKKMEKEFLLGKVEIFIRDLILMIKDMDMGSWNGQMVLGIKENGKWVSNMGMANYMILSKIRYEKGFLKIMC